MQTASPWDHRRELLSYVTEDVERGELHARALRPFLYMEPVTSLVCSAAIDYACARPLDDGDPLTGPRALLEIFRRDPRGPISRAGVFVELLQLGDRRARELAWRARPELTLEELRVVTSCHSGCLYAPVIDFAVAWLWKCEVGDSRFGILAAWLIQQLEGNTSAEVLELERDFPLTKPGEPGRVVQQWSVSEYASLMAPVLLELSNPELEPRVLPGVLAASGLGTSGTQAGRTAARAN